MIIPSAYVIGKVAIAPTIQRIEDALNAGTGSSLPLQCVKASGYTHRRLPRDPVRYVSVNLRHRPASSPRAPAGAR